MGVASAKESTSHLRDREGFHKATWARRPRPQTQWTEPIFPIFSDRTSSTASRVSPSPSLRMTAVTSPTPSSILTVKAGYSSWVRPLCTHSDKFTCTHVADTRTYTSGGDLCSARLPDPPPSSLLAHSTFPLTHPPSHPAPHPLPCPSAHLPTHPPSQPLTCLTVYPAIH